MEIVKLTKLYGENPSSDHVQNCSRNRFKTAVKLAFNMTIVKSLNLQKYMVVALGQTTRKSGRKIASKLPYVS